MRLARTVCCSDTPRHPGEAIHNASIGILPEPEVHLQARVLANESRPDLLRPAVIRGGYRCERIGDLVDQVLVGGDQGCNELRHGNSENETEPVQALTRVPI